MPTPKGDPGFKIKRGSERYADWALANTIPYRGYAVRQGSIWKAGQGCVALLHCKASPSPAELNFHIAELKAIVDVLCETRKL